MLFLFPSYGTAAAWLKVDRLCTENHKLLELAELAKSWIKTVLVYNKGILFKAERAPSSFLSTKFSWAWQEERKVGKNWPFKAEK